MYPVNQTFLVLGLSRSGCAAAEFLLGRKAKVYIYDDVPGEGVEKAMARLEEKGAERISAEQLPRMHETCDVLVLSPGIPIDHPTAVAFKRGGRAVVGETELAARYMRCPVVAVTGTNGKTTTVSMLEKILSDGGLEAHACGNIGTPMIEYVQLAETAVAVAEISSFQLETLGSLCPHVGVVLNVTEDHLNRHYNMDNYIFLKSKLLKNSTEAEYAVLNFDDGIVRGFAEKTKARILYFSVREKVHGAYLENGELYFCGEHILSASELLTDGLHNIQNALAAIAAAKIMGVPSESIARSLASFKGIRHRIEYVGEADGIKYVDDSKGTNVDATIKAVGCMKGETVLLLGGKDKGYDYDKLFVRLRSSSVVHAVIYGENRFRLLESALRCGFDRMTLCAKFDFAVRLARMIAERGQTVLLSPASASFDEFASYEERGDQFVAIVRSFEEESVRNSARAAENKKEDVPQNGEESPSDDGASDGAVSGTAVAKPIGAASASGADDGEKDGDE